MPGIIIPIIILFVGLVIGGIIWGHIAEKKRREALASLAYSLGLSYSAERQHDIASRFSFLDKLRQGDNRYAYNIMEGRYRDCRVKAFDFHYETHSTDSKGHRQTHHHHFSCFMLRLEHSFPELTIAKEGILSKIAQAVGYADIDFESAEFSRRFVVRSMDKKFAYDFCNAQMIDYLLDNRDLTIEVERDALAISFGRRLAVEQIRAELDRLVGLRERMPDYLFADRS